MNIREIGRTRGREAGAKVKNTLAKEMAVQEGFVRQLYPTIGDMDVRTAWRDCDRERLACEPDYTKFPEARGLIERFLGEREGFREAAGCDETGAAFFYSATWFCHKRLNARHVARWDTLMYEGDGCTNVFIPDGIDGVTIGDNRDVPLPKERFHFRGYWPSHLWKVNARELHWCQGGVSSGILLDEEPACSFPINPHELLPDDCRNDIKSIIEFLTRYSDFWGPCKQLWVDRQLRAVGAEKSNRLIGIIPADPKTGAVAVTACSYITPEIQPYRDQQFKRAAELKGESLEENVDWNFVQGGDARQRRLSALTTAEARRGGTIWGALEVVADHAVPYPERVCLAGEKTFPKKERQANWSVVQHAAVLTGPNRRILSRAVEDAQNPVPVYNSVPKLRLAPGVQMQPEWQADVDSGKCQFVPASE